MRLTNKLTQKVQQKANAIYEQYEEELSKVAYQKKAIVIEKMQQKVPLKAIAEVEEFRKEIVTIGIKVLGNFMLEEGMEVKEKWLVVKSVTDKMKEQLH